MKHQAKVHSASDVAEETLQRSKVRLPGIMHMETDLLSSVGEVRPGEGEVLQSASQTPVGSRISHRITQISRQLRLSVDRSEQGLQSVIPARSRISRAYCRW